MRVETEINNIREFQGIQLETSINCWSDPDVLIRAHIAAPEVEQINDRVVGCLATRRYRELVRCFRCQHVDQILSCRPNV